MGIPNKDGVCKMCNHPLIVVNLRGETPVFCDDCKEKIQAKTKMAMEKRGKIIGNKRVVFIDERK